MNESHLTPENCMAISIDEANKCLLDDGHNKPRVGVVIVKNGTLIGKGFRGEKESGEHGEYTVIDKKLSGIPLDGTTVYTTLEPCTKRSPSKLPCALRLIQARVAHVYIGMVDPNPDISGHGIRMLRDAGIKVDLYPPQYASTVESQNRHFTNQYKIKSQHSEIRSSEIRICDYKIVQEWGWSYEKLLDVIIKLDYEEYPDLDEKWEGTLPQWATVFGEHPDTWRLLVEGEQTIVGYWHFVPLFDKDYAVAKNGTLEEDKITLEKIQIMGIKGWHNIYFDSVCIKREFRGVKITKLWFYSLLQAFLDLAKNKIYIKNVCANAITDAGIAICRSLNLKEIRKHKIRGIIFEDEMINILKNPLTEDFHELKKIYSNEWSNRT